MLRRGLGAAALIAAFVLAVSAVPAGASPGDYDGDGILDRYDASPKNPFRARLEGVKTSDLSFSFDGTSAKVPAVAYVESFGSSSMTVVSADIRGRDLLGTRVYAGPVFITKAKIRNLASLDLDADIMIGATVNTHATATAPNGGALVQGQGLCLSVKNVREIVEKLESVSGMTVTLFNLAQVVDTARSALSNIKMGVCGFVLAIKNGGKYREVLNQASPLFPGLGRADRITADVWGNVNWKTTGWRVPLQLRIPRLASFANGRLSTSAV